MADTTFTSFPSARPTARGFFAAWMDQLARTDRIDALNALSDAELAARGLRREDIARHVYRDRSAF